MTTESLDAAGAAETLRRTAEAFRRGGLVIFPTETVYGIGASATSSDGLANLRALKQRPGEQPFTVHMPDPASAERYIDAGSPVVQRLIRKVFPGPVTLIVEVDDHTIGSRLRELGLGPDDRHRLYHEGTIGLRCPDHEAARRILASVDDPIVATSANLRGQNPPTTVEAAAAAVGDAAEVIIDGGPCRYSKPSTIVRIAGQGIDRKISVLREGVFDERYIRKMLRWTALFVCTGNTCRSPMAEAIAKDVLARERGLKQDELETAGFRVTSAGVAAGPGMMATAESVEAMQRMGIDLNGHRSRSLTPEMISEADVIYCMTENHRAAVLAMAPSAADKTVLLGVNQDIDDPIGAGLDTYLRCAEMIRRRIEQQLKEQQL